MRPKFLVGVIVGILLMYLSLFGISGFGLLLTGTLEDFTTYTKVDPGNYLSVTSQSVIQTAMPRSASSYVYKDFGVGHFGDFEIQFEAQLSSISVVGTPNAFYILVLANDIGASSQMTLTTMGVSIFYDGAVYQIQFGDGRVSYTFWTTVNPFSLYYFSLTRSGSQATLKVFTSSTYVNPVATLTCTIGDKFQYLYAAMSGGYVAQLGTVSGKTQNLIIGGGAPTFSDVTISVSGQGTTVPAAGHYTTTYPVGGSLTITATPASGWTFDYMTRNGVTTSSMTLTSLGATEQVVVYFKQGSPTTGTLRIFASYNGAYVVASITATGPQTVYGSTTTSSTNPLAFTVTAGTYVVSGTYSSGSASPVPVTVLAGGSADASLNFGGSPPPPDFLAAIITAIKNFFNQFAVKSILMVAGVALTIGGSIMFLLKGKGERSRPPPYYSPY